MYYCEVPAHTIEVDNFISVKGITIIVEKVSVSKKAKTVTIAGHEMFKPNNKFTVGYSFNYMVNTIH